MSDNFCSAEFSYEECGGFGGDVARYNRDFGGMPANVAAAYGAYLGRLRNTYDALAATYALNHGHPEIAAALMAANPTLQIVALLSKAETDSLALITSVYGLATGHQASSNMI